MVRSSMRTMLTPIDGNGQHRRAVVPGDDPRGSGHAAGTGRTDLMPACTRQKKARTSVRAKERPLAEDVTTPHNTAQNECRIPIRTSACVCVVDGVKL